MRDEQKPSKTPLSQIGKYIPYLGLAAGFLLLGVYFAGEPMTAAQYCRKIRFHLTPAHWPGWYAAVLWLFALWSFGVFRLRLGGRVLGGRVLGAKVFLALLVAIPFFYSEFLRPARQFILGNAAALVLFPYRKFYLPFVYHPLIEYNVTGTFTWRLLTLPLLVVVVIAAVWAVNHHIKGKNRSEKK